MTTLAEVFDRVKAQCPSFASVTHAFTSPEDYDFPAAIVSPVQYQASDDYLLDDTQVRQDLRRTFGVYILMRRASDPASGDTRADLFDTLHDELRAALVGWNSGDEAWSHFRYAGGALRQFETGAPAVWRDDFTVEAAQP